MKGNIRKRRYAFSESFAAIAYGELAKATGEDEYAEKARVTFKRFVDHSLKPQGVEPKFTEVRPTKGLAFPMITKPRPKNFATRSDCPMPTSGSIEALKRYGRII